MHIALLLFPALAAHALSKALWKQTSMDMRMHGYCAVVLMAYGCIALYENLVVKGQSV